MIRAVICDDEKAAPIIIRHAIESRKMPIEIVGIAQNGPDALRLIQKEKPELVFLDIQMPFMSGLDILKKVSGCKVIIITAYDSFTHAQQALRFGACDILSKPIDMEQLVEAVTRAVGGWFTENELTNTVLSYLYSHYQEQIRMENLAQLTASSAGHISRTFKKYTGYSVLSYMHKIRIEKSIQMLADGVPVKEAAKQSGYQNLNHYYKFFKEFTDKTPGQYIQDYCSR